MGAAPVYQLTPRPFPPLLVAKSLQERCEGTFTPFSWAPGAASREGARLVRAQNREGNDAKRHPKAWSMMVTCYPQRALDGSSSAHQGLTTPAVWQLG